MESRPEGVGLVAEVMPNEGNGVRLHLDSGMVLTIGPPGTRSISFAPEGPGSLTVYGHDRRGLWVVWLGLDPNRGPDCFALPKIGYDRQAFIGWPGDGFALPKAEGFHVGEGVWLTLDPQSNLAGWYSNGGLVPGATFCISSEGEVASVAL
jgi:hypothetical protein